MKRQPPIKNVKNKRLGVAMILLGVTTIFIENDATVCLWMLMLGIPLLVAKENWVS